MSIVLMLKKLHGKIHYIHGSVEVNNGVVLDDEEQQIFEEFKQYVELKYKHTA